MPESDLRQPGAKSLLRMRDKLVGRIRRNDHHVSGSRKETLTTILNGLAAPLDNISDQRGQHAPWLGPRSSSQVEKTAGQHAQRRDGVTTENAHVSERKLALGEHRGLDHARQDIDPLLLALLFNEARFVVVVMLCCDPGLAAFVCFRDFSAPFSLTLSALRIRVFRRVFQLFDPA